MWSMWNAPSDRDCYDPLGLDCDQDEPEICGDCSARWDRGEACEDLCTTNRQSRNRSRSVPSVGDEEVNLAP
jgi:hypothetical protein